MSSDTEPTKLRAVLDSNVIFSGFAFPRGNPASIIYAIQEGRVQVYLSPFILEEVSRNWREKFQWEETRIERVLLFLTSYCTIINPPPTLSLQELSPEDNRVLDCAVQGQVQYLVTGDRGILELKEYEGIAVVTPREFFDLLREK